MTDYPDEIWAAMCEERDRREFAVTICCTFSTTVSADKDADEETLRDLALEAMMDWNLYSEAIDTDFVSAEVVG